MSITIRHLDNGEELVSIGVKETRVLMKAARIVLLVERYLGDKTGTSERMMSLVSLYGMFGKREKEVMEKEVECVLSGSIPSPSFEE